MFRASSAHLQEDSGIHAAYGTVTLYKSSWWPVDKQLAAYRQFLCKMWPIQLAFLLFTVC